MSVNLKVGAATTISSPILPKLLVKTKYRQRGGEQVELWWAVTEAGAGN